jgi:uncharacterized protein
LLELHNAALAWLLRLLVYPLLEEYVFRAGLLHWLNMRFPALKGWRTNIFVSAIFAIAHLWTWPLLHGLAVFFPSLIFGWIWQRYQKLWLCVLVHAAFNAIGYTLHENFPSWMP